MKIFGKVIAALMLVVMVMCTVGCKKETYNVSVSANPLDGGVVTGGGNYQGGRSCTVNATANEGYIFKNWTENGNIVSTDAGYTFNVMDNRTLVANFGTAVCSINVSANPPEGGIVTGGGTCQQGSSCTVIARTNPGYTFTGWTENGNVVSMDKYYTFNVNGNRDLVANFNDGSNNYTIAVSSNPLEGGIVTGGGTYQQGSSCTVIARTNPGYTFTGWTENGNVVSTNSNYMFSVNGNRDLVANFNDGSINDYDFTPSGSINGYDYVDLGLSVKWATCNIGAGTIENSGDYYAWQETTPVSPLTHINYDYFFNPCSPDNNLSSVYDAATVNLGANWRMPTWEEMDELCRNCDWSWADNFQSTGVAGCIIKSRVNNKSIFLPASGYININNQLAENSKGFYWSSYAGPGDLWSGFCTGAMNLTFYQGGIAYGGNSGTTDRSCGLPIRAVVGTPNNYIPEGPFPLDEIETGIQGFSVSGTKNGMTYVDLGLPSRTLWATYNIGATAPREYGDFYAWGEIAPKEIYTDTNYIFYDGVYFSGTNYWTRFSKYTWYEGHHGTVDGKLKLEPEDDAATQNIGANWSMPTKTQFEELAKYVYWIQDGTAGWIGTSKINGYTIYIPSAGWEYNTVPNTHMSAWYWSCDLMEPSPNNSDYYSYMLTNSPQSGLETHDTRRVQGLSVRGVTK